METEQPYHNPNESWSQCIGPRMLLVAGEKLNCHLAKPLQLKVCSVKRNAHYERYEDPVR